MSNYTLTYRKGRSQEIYIEEIGKDEHLYFQQEYNNALRLIKEIVDLQRPENDNENGENGKEKKYENKKIAKYGCNNRVLFAGQRGCGKTSLMRSLADYLAKPEKELNYKDWEKIDFETRFCCLPMVDPSHFDNNNNILLTVITSMFSEAKRKMNDDKDGGDTSYREDLLKQFEKVFKSLDSIKSELSSYTLESLNRKSDAEDLKDKMKNLVDKYLAFQGLREKSRLVLLIDDLDMSVSYAPEMLEQLRKYLELDNLIILMSANLGQLSNEMREKYSSAFQYTLKDSNQALSIDVEDLATKYLLKLFPTSRRINVERHTSQLLETDLIIKETGKNDIKDRFQKVILSLIWSKTRLLFIPKDSENTLHPIIPTNLRDLAQFLDMLTSLSDVGCAYKYKEGDNTIKESRIFAHKKDYDSCKYNLQIFKNYFMKTWIPNHLNVGEELVFHNIPADITEINKHLINSINIIGTNHKDDLMSREVGLDIIERNADNVYIDRDIYTMVSPNDPKFVKANKISDIFNQPSNYSYGDLLLMIDKYETYFESEEHRKFTDAIKIYYTILLFETMFFKSQNVKYDYNEGDEYDVIPIQKLIGGNVYYPNYFEIITDKNFNQKGPSYDAKRAFYHKVKVDGEKVGGNYPLFAVLYYGDIRPDRYEKDHIYDTTFEKNADVEGVNYVTFDILSILNNMLNPCHTLSRLDEKHRDLNKWQRFVDGISDWGEKNKIDNAFIPNAILPFYSVDIMLNYLRKDFGVSEICTPPDTKSAKGLADDYYFFFELERCKSNHKVGSNKTENENSENEIKGNENPVLIKLLDEVLTRIQQHTKVRLNLSALNCDSFEQEFVNAFVPKDASIFSDENQVRAFASYLRVICKAYVCYYKITNDCHNVCDNRTESIIEFYKNRIIALVLGIDKQFMSKKEKETLVKEIHKYETVSEVYSHLVEVLWKNSITELCIRGVIQKEVRSPEAVRNYYNKLWEKTRTMLSSIDYSSSEALISVYKKVFYDAEKIFIQ